MITEKIISVERLFERELVLPTPVIKPLIYRSTMILSLQLFISILIPLILLLFYHNYAATNGIILATGCEGPDIPFSMLSGLLFALQLRLSLPKNLN